MKGKQPNATKVVLQSYINPITNPETKAPNELMLTFRTVDVIVFTI